MISARKNLLKICLVIFLVGGIIFFSETGRIKTWREKIAQTFFPVLRKVGSGGAFLARGNDNIAVEEDALRIKGLEFELQKKEREISALKEALGLRGNGGVPPKSANVIFYSTEAGREFILIDRGAEYGIKEGDLVVDEKRLLIGNIIEAGNAYSKVDFAANPGAVFEVEIPRLNVRALAEGIGSRAFAVKLIPRDAQIVQGDLISLVDTQNKTPLLGEIVSAASGGGAAFWDIKALSLARPELVKIVFIITLR